MQTYDETDASGEPQKSQADRVIAPLPLVQNLKKKVWSTLKPAVQKSTIVAIVGVASIGVIFYGFLRFKSTPHSSPTPAASVAKASEITALGRLEPRGEVIKLSVLTSVEGSRVDQLLVKQGDRVQRGQVVAILDTHDSLLTALDEAKEQVKVTQTRLAQVEAGAKTGQINAQQATIERLEAELSGEITAQAATVTRLQAEVSNAQVEYQRYQALYQSGAVSASTRDSKRLTLDTVQQQLNEAKANLNRIKQAQPKKLNEAKATLNSIAEVRPVDVQAAQAEVDHAIAAVRRAQAELDLASVRSPRDGQIMKIHTWPGEVVSNEGIVDLGQTSQMYVVAEVYETDIGKVRLGQKATITSSAFAGNLQGTVDQIGLEIGKKDVLDTDPTESIDARVVEVKIRLSPMDSQKVASLTNLQVKTVVKL